MVFSSESETNLHMTIAVLMFLVSAESLYRFVTDGVTRSCVILSKIYFLFIFLSGWSLRMFLHIWTMHLLQQCWSCHKTLPLSLCEFLAVLCTLHTFDPTCILQAKLIFLSHPFYTVTLCVSVKMQKQQANDSTKFIQRCSPHPFLNFASEVEEINMNFFWLVCVSI